MRKRFSSLQRASPVQRREFGGAALIAIGFLASAAAVTSAVIWTLHLTATSRGVPEFSKAVVAKTALPVKDNREALAQMFGAPVATAAAASRDIDGVKLLGIVADRAGTGVALFSIDGAAPVRVRSGSLVRDGVKLVEVRPQQVVLERGGSIIEIAAPARVMLPPGKK